MKRPWRVRSPLRSRMHSAGQHELPCWPVSLRFKSEQLEAGFASTRRPVLTRRIRSLSCLHLFACVCFLLTLFATQQWERSSFSSDIAFDAVKVQGLGQCILILVLLLVLAVSWLWERSLAHCTFFLVEAFVVVTMIFSMCWMTFLSPTRFVKFQGYSLLEAYGDPYDSDAGILLIIDVFVTVAHLGMPIRWFVMAPLELAAVLAYALILGFIGSEEKIFHVCVNYLALVCLVFCSALGKRSAELDERRAFLAMLSEKALRCEAEFQLSQVTGRRLSGRTETRSEGPSEAVTDRSGAIFDPLYEQSVDTSEQLEMVAAKGESEHWRIAAEEVRLLSEEVLGSGGFGSVQRAVFCGMMVAVKCPHLEVGAVKVPDLCNELRILRHLRHPHIVAAHGAIILPKEQQIYLVLELIDGVDLVSFVIPRDPEMRPSVLARYQVMLGICRALLYMHTRVPHVVHGDLKGSNIMVELSNGCAFPKVLDFGLSRVINAHSRALGGTLSWMAPEVVDRAPVRCSADIYSFGHIIAFTATGVPPMLHMTRRAIQQALRKKRVPLPRWPPSCPFKQSCEPLVRACLAMQQELRPQIGQVHQELLGLSSKLNHFVHHESYLQKVQEIAGLMDRELSVSMQRPVQLASLPEDEILADSGASDPPTSSGSPSRRRRVASSRRFPQLPETDWGALEGSLLATFRRWNVSLPTTCCGRHAYFRLGREVCSIVLEADCGEDLCPGNVPVHCQGCGILGVEGFICDLCGHLQPSSEGSSASDAIVGRASL